MFIPPKLLFSLTKGDLLLSLFITMIIIVGFILLALISQ